MNYTKPRIDTLGKAIEVIEFVAGKPISTQLDGTKRQNPAYDLDE